MGAPLQLSLKKIRVELHPPLIRIATARAMLNVESDAIRELYQTGDIAWAWDIGLGREHQEVRLLTRSVNGYATTQEKCGLGGESVESVIAHILAREHKPWVEGVHLKFLLDCERWLIMDLVRQCELLLLPKTSYTTGPNGSPKITRESVIKFLKQRRIK